jgi:hypothetical protein
MGITTDNIWGTVKRVLPCGDDEEEYQTAPGGFAPAWTTIPSWIKSVSRASTNPKKTRRMASAASSSSYRTAPSRIPSEMSFYSAKSRLPSQTSDASFHTARSRLSRAVSGVSSEASWHTARTHQSVEREIRFPVRLGDGKKGWRSIGVKSIPKVGELPSWRWTPRRKYPVAGY